MSILPVSASAAALPSQDIAILELSPTSDFSARKVSLSNQKNSSILFYLTYRQGYDNQPKFSSDGKIIYFTRMLDKQTDIMEYSFDKKQLRNLTNTKKKSEYSATPYKKGFVSFIGVNSESKQHLKKIDVNTGVQTSFNDQVEPVGYHAWLNQDEAALFVLGDVMTLQVMDLSQAALPKVLLGNIGRCFEKLGQNKVSFTQEINGVHHIKFIDEKLQITDSGIILPEGVQDYAWLNDTELVYAKGSKFYLNSMQKRAPAGKLMFDLKQKGIQKVTRLAFDKNSRRLAFVFSSQ